MNSKFRISTLVGLTIVAFVTPHVTLAANNAANQSALLGKSSKLSNGIDTDQLAQCLYNPDQSSFKEVLVNPENPKLLNNNLTEELKAKAYCKQALALYHITHSLPAAQSLKKYQLVSVYYSYTTVNGEKTYFMIDNKGQVLRLTNNINVTNSDGYLDLDAKYPAKDGNAPTLTNLAQNYPTSSNLPNDGLRLVFAQDVTFGGCPTCKKIGEANIAYDFDKKGHYIQSAVINVRTK